MCCLVSEVSKGGQESHCDNCWNYLMPANYTSNGLQWGDIWSILCHWHAIHDEQDNDFEFVHKIILLCYKHEGRC